MKSKFDEAQGDWRHYETLEKKGLAKRMSADSSVMTVSLDEVMTDFEKTQMKRAIENGFLIIYYVKKTNAYVSILTKDGESALKLANCPTGYVLEEDFAS